MTTQNNMKTTAQQNNMSNSYNNSLIFTNINILNNSSTNVNRHNRTNNTFFDLTVPSPTAEIATHQINVSAITTNFAIKSASDPTRAADSTSPRPPVPSTPAYFTIGTTLGNKTNNKTASKSKLHCHYYNTGWGFHITHFSHICAFNFIV